jgi:hypothetical protein
MSFKYFQPLIYLFRLPSKTARMHPNPWSVSKPFWPFTNVLPPPQLLKDKAEGK